MRTKNLFIIISFAALLFLVGCQSYAPQTGQYDKNGQSAPATEQATLTQNADATKSYSAADQAAYEGAQRLKDSSFCDKISDESYKKTCKNTIVDQMVLEEATTKMDTGLCAKLSSADQQKACTIRIQVLLKEQENSKKQEEERKNAGTLRDQLVKAGDYKRCQELKIEGYVNECEIVILSQKAIAAKDISWCDKTKTKNNQEQCKIIFNKLNTTK